MGTGCVGAAVGVGTCNCGDGIIPPSIGLDTIVLPVLVVLEVVVVVMERGSIMMGLEVVVVVVPTFGGGVGWLSVVVVVVAAGFVVNEVDVLL